MTTRSMMMIFQLIMCCLLVQSSLQAPPSDTKVNSNEQIESLKKLCDVRNSKDYVFFCQHNEMHLVLNNEISESNDIWKNLASLEPAYTNLELSGNTVPINFVPTIVLQSFKNLNTFEVKQGNLSTIPARTFADLKTIKQIKLQQAGIKELEPNAFYNLPELEELYLESNNITEIKEKVFVDVSAVKKLHLNRNQIKTISDKAFEYLDGLIELDLSENKISQLKQETFQGLKNLMYLNLSFNNLPRLEYQPFMVLTSLKSLNLASNKIESFVSNTFHNLKDLETLNLSNNKLSLQNTDLFENTNKINLLDLSGNGIKRIDFVSVRSVFQNFNNTGFVNLEGNNFTCDCELSWILSLKNESLNDDLKKSLANISCFLEEGKETVLVTNNITETTPSSTPTNSTNNASVLVEGKRGHMKQFSELYFDGLPCNTPPKIMDSSSSRQENAQLSESSSAKVQIALGIFTLTAFLLV